MEFDFAFVIPNSFCICLVILENKIIDDKIIFIAYSHLDEELWGFEITLGVFLSHKVHFSMHDVQKQ